MQKEIRDPRLWNDDHGLSTRHSIRPPVQGSLIQTAFEEWWAAYPRKKAKIAAAKAYESAVRRIGGQRQNAEDQLLKSLKAYRFSADPNYRPYPATWLNRGSWLDEPESESFDSVLEAAGLRVTDYE